MVKMKLKYIFITLLFLIAFNLSANVTFKAQKPGVVVEGDVFQITFTLTNGEASNFKGPQIEGCKLMSDKGVSRMSTYQNINGVASSATRIDYTCTYRANTSGKVNVPSVTINVDGKQYKSQAFSLNINKNTGTPNQRLQKSIFDEEYSSQTPGAISGNELFVRIIMSKQTAYEQEPIECTIKLYTQYGIRSFLATTQPSFDGFIIEEIPIKNIQEQVESYNGKTYNTAILKKCLIFPQKSGKLTINSGKYELTAEKYEKVSFGGGFAYNRIPIREKLSISSNTATINILPLPQPQPENFSGAVGHYEISSKLVPNSIRTNETATFSYIISGTGNIKYIKEPVIDFPQEFELYAPKNDIKTSVIDGSLKGNVTFDYTFIPLSVGKFKIPEHEFVYFDPESKEYKTLKTKSYEVNVNKGLTVNQQEDKSKNNDIRHIKLGNKGLQPAYNFCIFSIWYWLMYIFIAILFVAFVYQFNKHKKLNADVIGLRIVKANKVARKRLKTAHQFMLDHKNKEFYEEIVNALWGYLSDKLSMPTSQLFRDNIANELLKYGATESICNDVISVLNECDMALYSPQLSENAISDLFSKTELIIDQIESIKTRKR